MGRRHKAHARDVQALHERLHDAFEMRKAKVRWRLAIIPGGRQHRTSQGDGQAALLQGQFFAWLGQIYPANLEQRHALAIAAVGPQGLQHARQQRLPQKFALLTDRIGQPM